MISSCLMMVDLFPPYTLFVVQVPAFETVEGTPIYESNAIAYYGEFSRGAAARYCCNAVSKPCLQCPTAS